MLSEVVVHDRLWFYAKRIKIVCYSLDEHRWSAEIILAIFGCIVILEISVANAVNGKSGVILHTCSVGLGIGSVE